MQLSFESSFLNYPEDFGIGIFNRAFSTIWYQFVKYGITLKIKEDKEVIILADGWYFESAFLFSACFASDGLTINISAMSMQTWCLFL